MSDRTPVRSSHPAAPDPAERSAFPGAGGDRGPSRSFGGPTAGVRTGLRHRFAVRCMVLAVLAAYAALFVKWSLADRIGPDFCCEGGEIHQAALSLVGCDSHGSRAVLARDPWWRSFGLSFAAVLQAAWFRCVGPSPPVPLLPVFALYLASLGSVFLLASRLYGHLGAGAALLWALTGGLYSMGPLLGGPANAAAPPSCRS